MKRHAAIIVLVLLVTFPLYAEQGRPSETDRAVIHFSKEHLSAVARQRRIIHHYDPGVGALKYPDISIEECRERTFKFVDAGDHQIDGIWWDMGAGDHAIYPSKLLIPIPASGYKEWLAAGNDLLATFIAETRTRNLEVFFSYRVNSTDYPTELPLKKQHPEWMINFNEDPAGPPDYHCPWESKNHPSSVWNFALEPVRDFKVRVLREIAENYDLDGFQLDFARICPVLPVGHQWEHRHSLTQFMRAVRNMLQEVAGQRGKPFLLAVKIPETLSGCHFDGMHIETWVEDRLVDILILGSRSIEPDIRSFQQLVRGSHIRVYPSHDDHHASDGYKYASLDVLRGITSNWWQQGATGIQIFNFAVMERRAAVLEIGSQESLRRKDKTFVVGRRAGGHPWIFGYPEQRQTQTSMYHNSNMVAQLPARLGNHASGTTFVHLNIGDDVNADASHVDAIRLRVLLSDPFNKDLPAEQCIEPAIARPTVYSGDEHVTVPITKQLVKRVELRLNNIHLGQAAVEKGWLTFSVKPEQLAVGENLVRVRLRGADNDTDEPITIEKLELKVSYRSIADRERGG